MAGPDLKDKVPETDAPKDTVRTESDSNSLGDYDAPKASQEPPQANQQGAVPNADARRKKQSRIAKKAREKMVQEGKKRLKQVAEKTAEKTAKEGVKFAAKEGLVAGASLAGSEVPVVGNLAAGAVAEVAVDSVEVGAKLGKEGVHVVTHIEELGKEPKKVEDWFKKWGKWIIRGIVLILVLILIFMLAASSNIQQFIDEEEAYKKDNPLTFDKTCPDSVPNTTTPITCTLTATYPGTAEDIVVYDQIPFNAEYVSTPQKFTTSFANGKISGIRWSAKENGVDVGTSPITFTVTITIHPTSGTRIYNFGNATAVGGSLGDGTAGTSTEYVAPNTNTCGRYDFSKWPEKNPLGNFGDPSCNYSQDAITNLIKSLDPDPTHLHIWYDIIVKGETAGTYSPNSFSGFTPAQVAIDACGAWGLYQMGSTYLVVPNGTKHCDPGKPLPSPGKNGVLDRGDLNWEIQTTNAIEYNKNLINKGLDWCYWATAKAAGYAKGC